MRIRRLKIENDELCMYTLWRNGSPDGYRTGRMEDLFDRMDLPGRYEITADTNSGPVYDKSKIVWTDRPMPTLLVAHKSGEFYNFLGDEAIIANLVLECGLFPSPIAEYICTIPVQGAEDKFAMLREAGKEVEIKKYHV